MDKNFNKIADWNITNHAYSCCLHGVSFAACILQSIPWQYHCPFYQFCN